MSLPRSADPKAEERDESLLKAPGCTSYRVDELALGQRLITRTLYIEFGSPKPIIQCWVEDRTGKVIGGPSITLFP